MKTKLNLKEAREKSGMTLQELAKAAGVTAATICRSEQGLRTPKLATAKKLGIILDIPWYQLIDNKKVS